MARFRLHLSHYFIWLLFHLAEQIVEFQGSSRLGHEKLIKNVIYLPGLACTSKELDNILKMLKSCSHTQALAIRQKKRKKKNEDSEHQKSIKELQKNISTTTVAAVHLPYISYSKFSFFQLKSFFEMLQFQFLHIIMMELKN